RALRTKLPVAPQLFEPERRHLENSLGLRVEAAEVVRPFNPFVFPPFLDDLPGSPEAGPGVDHRGAADGPAAVASREAVPGVDHRGAPDGPADRDRDGRLPGGNRHPAVAVEQRQTVKWIAPISMAGGAW